MKAILRSINNFSCKLKQSNNLKYNVSPKIRSNKFKNISGNGNVTIEDAIKRNLKDYKIYGNTYQNSTSGKNLYNTNDMKTITSPAIINGEIIEISYDNTSGTTKYIEFHTNISSLITENETYSIICEILEINGTGTLRLNSLNNNLNQSQFSVPSSYNISNLTSGQILIDIVTALSDFENALCCIRSNIRLGAGQSCSVKLRMSLIKGTVSENNFSYEPYTGGHPSPNPDYPQEIISRGDRTKNLFDKNNANIINGYIQGNTGKIISGNSDLIAYIKCKPNTQYSFQRMQIRDNKGRIRIGTTQTIPIADMAVENFYYKGNSEYSTNKLDGYTTGANAEYLLFYFSQISGMSQNEIDTILSSIQIEENSIATSHEPYGYKIPVNVRSDNLFDISTVTSVDNGSISDSLITSNTITQSVVQNIRPRFSTPFPFKVGTYYISADIRRKSGTGELNKINDGFTDYTKVIFPNLTNEFQKYVVRHQYNSDTSYSDGRLLFQVASNSNQLVLEIKNIMISTSNDYIYVPYYNETTNIYLDEPLRKIDEYSDYIDFINGKVVRNISEYKITGSEDFANSFGTNLFDAQNLFNDKPFITNYGLCNMYRYNSIQSGINNNTINGEFVLQKVYYAATGLKKYNLFIKNTFYNDLDAFKTYLQDLYNSGTPVIINYPLETSTEESITLPNINLIEGKNIITIGTDVQGVFETEYYSKEIIDISNYKYNLRKVED